MLLDSLYLALLYHISMILFYLFDIILWNTITRRERCHLMDFFTPHDWGVAKRVTKRSHPENQSTFEQELILQIRSNRQSHRMLLSAHPVLVVFSWLKRLWKSSPTIYFIMVLRKYLQGAVIGILSNKLIMIVLWKSQFPIKRDWGRYSGYSSFSRLWVNTVISSS